MKTKVQDKTDTGTADRFAVVATVDGKTSLLGTTTATADPQRLLRAFPLADFHPDSGNHLRVMRWADWKRAEAGEPARGLDLVDDVEPDAPVDDHRAQVIAGLLELAAFLHDNPDVPVNRYEVNARYSANEGDGDEAAIARVHAMAAALGVEVGHRGSHWFVERMFGAVRYGCSYVERAEVAAYNAALSYQGTVEPDGSQS